MHTQRVFQGIAGLLFAALLALATPALGQEAHSEDPAATPHAETADSVTEHGAMGHAPVDTASHAAGAHGEEGHADESHGTVEGHGAAHGEEGLDVQSLLFHHLIDTHDWHLFDLPGENGHYHPVALRLPWIAYHSQKGLDVFTLHAHDHHALEEEARANGYAIDHYGRVSALAGSGDTVIDFSVTKLVIQLFLVGLVLLWVFGRAAKVAAKRAGQSPKGLQSLLEPLVLFIRDEVARANLRDPHNKQNPYHYADKMTPYLLTVFFFIWFSNLFGLTPLNSNIAGNISFTTALTLCTFLLIQFNGSKDYWQHIFWYPGVATPIKFLMLPVELIGIFTKPLALAVRLFANITGGHIAVLALISLIFILTNNLGAAAGATIAPLSVLLTVVVFALEMIVAIVQAYIFTLLSAVFIGMAREKHDHGHHDVAHEPHDTQALQDPTLQPSHR